MKNKKIIVGTLCVILLLLSGCSATQVLKEKRDQQPQEVEQGDAQQFDYLIQYSGGEYLADPALKEYVSAIGLRLVHLMGKQSLKSEFFVINSATVNAWVSPEGRVAVSRGMLLTLENEAQLAALFGHLLAHAANQHQHTYLQRENSPDEQLLRQGAGHPYSRYLVGGGMSALAAHGIRYTHQFEQQADQQAIKLMVMAGYDPQAAVDLQLKWLRQDNGSQSLWLRNHAPYHERLAINRQAAHGQV